MVKALCANLGTILQMELGEKTGNYVRVRVAIPVYRALETSVAMTAKLQEKKTRVEFQIQYVKLPDFCYTCGYLGHKEKSCCRKVKGRPPSGKYSGKLKCSPPRRFGRQSGTVKAKVNPMAYRGLDFSSESTGSSARGRGGRGARRPEGSAARRQQHAVDHSSGNPAVDAMLAEKMQAMSGGSKGAMEDRHAHAEAYVHVQVQEHTSKGTQHSDYSQPRSSDMIPALRNLSQEVNMDDVDLSDGVSALGKRAAAGDQVAAAGGEEASKALVVYANTSSTDELVVSGTPKKRRTLGSLDGQQTPRGDGMMEQDMVDGTSTMEAAGPGAADELTGPAEPRQEE